MPTGVKNPAAAHHGSQDREESLCVPERRRTTAAVQPRAEGHLASVHFGWVSRRWPEVAYNGKAT